jgi:large subunit ribosomal protein L31
MKEKIHPKYYPDAKVTCGCGNTFTTGSTQKTLKVEICGKCHPFYTGERRMVDTAGRVERFTQRYKKAEEKKAEGEKQSAEKKS